MFDCIQNIQVITQKLLIASETDRIEEYQQEIPLELERFTSEIIVAKQASKKQK